jgi:hypothetical protein
MNEIASNAIIQFAEEGTEHAAQKIYYWDLMELRI